MEAPITAQDVQIAFYTIASNHEQPQYIIVTPWVWRRWKRALAKSQRRDKRRKHKRYAHYTTT